MQTGQPFRYDTFCRLFCLTKSYVTLAFGTLVDEGVLRFEDRLDKYLPAFKNMKVQLEGRDRPVKAKGPILLKHLPCHQSGLGYPVDPKKKVDTKLKRQMLALQRSVVRGKTATLKAFVDKLATLPLECHPGEKYAYGFSLDVLGRVLEIVCQTSLDNVLRERVFGPLGMHDTLWAVPGNQLHRLAALYSSTKTWEDLHGGAGRAPVVAGQGHARLDGRTANASNWSERHACPIKFGGGYITYEMGGLVSTVADTVRFVQMLLNKGVAADGRRYLRERTLAAMEKNRSKRSLGEPACYLGVVDEEGGTEFGMGGAANDFWSVDRRDEVAVVWFAQHFDLPEFAELKVKGAHPDKADIWKVMHEAVKKGVRKRPASARVSAAPKRRRGASC